MRSLCLLATLAVVLGAGSLAAGDAARAVRFEKGDVGKLPAGWKSATTGKNGATAWSVAADATGPGKSGAVLAQTGKSPGPVFNICVLEGASHADVEVSVAFKAVAGDGDQGGGIVWRYQDADNYYVARMNPLEDNLRFYKVVDGKRTELGRKEKIKVAEGTWHKLKIKHVGKKVEVWLNGNKEIEFEDETFAKAGLVGLWTKADAQTLFDELLIRKL